MGNMERSSDLLYDTYLEKLCGLEESQDILTPSHDSDLRPPEYEV
jgi:hypothetical protein